ncbi:unnamed protein product [Miscanthus lutarioriparius]|uniref:Polyamine transporter PUT1 n=1 Tax=Miscanthus lutarioriparius TaxID=422564 RepID=A0A811PQE1_9POAL|nr:unnamed protein product [Miscanthus lutarioriparius]
MAPLVFLIFYEVSGAPFGIEDSVRAAGPLLAILGFLLFALIWSIPEALITAEMGTMFPENGGYVVWVSSALGPFWGFHKGWAKWLSGVIDNALYPVLVLDYLKSSVPALGGGLPRTIAVLIFTVALTYMNYRGLTVIGWVAVFLGVFSLLPFLVMGLVAIPRIEPSRWLEVDLGSVDWRLYLNTLFWNLNYWDSISTLTGEVENPKRTLPKALSYALVLVVGGYLYPLITCTAAVPVVREHWSDGYFSDIARIIGGVWLQSWMQAVAALSNVGNFLTEMSSDSYQLLGMAERGMLPDFFAKRSRHGTPAYWHPVLCLRRDPTVLDELPGDRCHRELPLLLRHDPGVRCLHQASGDPSERLSALQGPSGHHWCCPDDHPTYSLDRRGDGPRVLQGDGGEHVSDGRWVRAAAVPGVRGEEAVAKVLHQCRPAPFA